MKTWILLLLVKTSNQRKNLKQKSINPIFMEVMIDTNEKCIELYNLRDAVWWKVHTGIE